MPWCRRQLGVRDPDVLLLLPLLTRPHRHAPILRTKSVDTTKVFVLRTWTCTTGCYANLSVAPQAGDLNQPVTVSFDVKNTGHREGAEVAELYVGDSHSSVPRPVKELKGFAGLILKPGETRRVTLTLGRRAFSFYDVKKNDWSAEVGDFTILVGGSSNDIRL